MLNVTEATKSAYMGSSIPKKLTVVVPNLNITITDVDIISESLELTEAIENSRSLTFKGCIASQIKFSVREFVTDIRGEYIEVSIQAGTTEVIPLFKGYVDSQDNQTHEDSITKFVCYDILSSVGGKNMQSWAEGLTYPITVKNFRDSLFSNLGITQVQKTLVNDNLTIQETMVAYLENPSALDIMRWICELNGVFGQIGRDGKFKYIELREITKGLYPSYTTYPSPTTYPSKENADASLSTGLYKSISYQPYETEKINKVVVYDSAGIDQGRAGSGTNIFNVSDNPIAFSVSMGTAASNLLGLIGSYAYIPFISYECLGQPYMECGDIILTHTKKNMVRTYVLNRTLKGVHALMDDISSDSDKSQPPYKATPTTWTNANKKTILQINADLVVMNEVIATKATISDLEASNARIGNLEADHVSISDLNASNARIGSLEADHVSVTDLNASNARIHDLEVDHVAVSDLNATNARVGSLEADHVTTQQLTAVQGDIQTLSTDKLDAQTASITYATITNLDAVSGRVGSLEADHVSTSSITALQGQINTLSADKIDANTVYADFMEVANWTSSGYIKADKIDANTIQAKISQLSTLSANAFLCNGGGATGNFAVGGDLSCTGTITTGGNEVATKSWVTANFKPK